MDPLVVFHKEMRIAQNVSTFLELADHTEEQAGSCKPLTPSNVSSNKPPSLAKSRSVFEKVFVGPIQEESSSDSAESIEDVFEQKRALTMSSPA